METVIYNLLSNALKFSPEGEKVHIDLSSSALKAEIRITNTGVSIFEDELPHIFDRFYQGDDSETQGFEGTGIGLALVKELIELHYGEVEVNSVQNEETTFKIILPLGNAHFSPGQAVEIEEKETEITFDEKKFDLIDEVEISGDRNKKPLGDSNIVLVVEDHFDLRNFICEQLEGDYSVIEAEDGEKGLKLAEEIIPDLVISDIMMPNMDGYQLCKELKTNINTNHIPVILLTAKAALENKLEGLETGADDYLIKPFNTTELKARVKNLIRVRQQMREKFRSEMILKPAKVIVPSNQKAFIEKLTNIIEKHIEDENFSVEALSKEIGMSRSQLHRKVKALTSQSPSEFIRVFRLQRAADLITQKAGNMAEISYMVGFSSQAYFTKLFQEMYGVTPSEFKKRI
jgi:DNA-binding response OmpR family regulator